MENHLQNNVVSGVRPKLTVYLPRMFLTFLLCTFIATALNAQLIKPKLVFKNFSVDDGLLSNEVFHVIQDSTGYVWIATANGINRFNGVDFKTYNIEDGLIDNTIYEIYNDYKGRLWFISSSGRLVYIENDTIKHYPFNNKITDQLPITRGPIKKSFHVDLHDNVHITFKKHGRLVIGAEGEFEKLSGIHEEGVVVVEKTDDGMALVSNPAVPKSYNFIYFDKAKELRYTINFKELSPRRITIDQFYCIPESDESFIMAVYGTVYRVTQGKIVQQRKFGEEIIWLSLDSDNNLWVAPIEGGIYCFLKAQFLWELVPPMLKNVQVSSVLQDHENGYWFSTLSHGVFYCPNINVVYFDSESNLPYNRVSTVFANKSGVYLGYEIGMVSKIYENRITNYTIGGERSSRIHIRYLGIDSTSNDVWIGSSFFLHNLKDNAVVDYVPYSKSWGVYPRDVIQGNDGNFWIASAQGLKVFDGKSVIYDSYITNEFSLIANSLYQDSSGCIWIGCMNGLWTYRNNVYSYLGQENPLFSKQINSVRATDNGTILLATNGQGLIVIKGKQVERITQADGLTSNHIKKLVVEKSGIWLVTNNGLSWIRNIDTKMEIQNINISHGLPTNDVNNIYVRGNEVFVATTKGLAVFDLRTIALNTVKANCLITNVRVNGKDLKNYSLPLLLDYDQNYITFDFIGFSFKNMGKVQYRYRLNELDSTWVYTSSTNAIFSGLSSGNYLYEVQAQNSEGIWGNSARIPIIIKPPYWKRAWFIALLAAILSSTFFLIYLARIRAIKRMNQIESSINMYKQQSLRQQMNPHFIFNTLNSIQLYILEKDSISSHKYLTKFAKLVRMTLDNSQYQSTSLKNELDALKLYLELESLRLEDSFNYSIEVEDNELLVKSIPTLLLQPFVENSIWHGIMHKPKQEGWIKIRVGSENGLIKCTIEDNGIGRKAAREKSGAQNGKYNSLGYKITSQRIELLNTLYSGKFNIQYEDLYAPDGTATGTRVVITIPCN